MDAAKHVFWKNESEILVRTGCGDGMRAHPLYTVMAGLVPAIHVDLRTWIDVDARAFAAPKRLRPRRRDKPGHDVPQDAGRQVTRILAVAATAKPCVSPQPACNPAPPLPADSETPYDGATQWNGT
ncbi:hypothetical protein ACVIJ6_002627 [Bradyrhizobium sp. USDA 4369]